MKATHFGEETEFAGAIAGNAEPEMRTLQHGSTLMNRGRVPRWLVTCFWLCVVIAIAVAMRRFIALIWPSGRGPAGYGLDAAFASRSALTLAHIIPATAFVLLAPFLLFRSHGNNWLERAFLVLGVMVAITAYAMSFDAYGGWVERSAVLFFNSLFLFSLVRSFSYAQVGMAEQNRQWTIRAIGILLGIATTRPVMGVFFATSRLTHLEPKQFFGMAFWIGFSMNTLVVEWWLRAGRLRTA